MADAIVPDCDGARQGHFEKAASDPIQAKARKTAAALARRRRLSRFAFLAARV